MVVALGTAMHCPFHGDPLVRDAWGSPFVPDQSPEPQAVPGHDLFIRGFLTYATPPCPGGVYRGCRTARPAARGAGRATVQRRVVLGRQGRRDALHVTGHRRVGGAV